MNLTKLLNSIKFAVASVAVVMSASGVSVSASDDFGGRQLVPKVDFIPLFFISEVDYTNNQIEFAYADQYTGGKQIDKVSVGWLSDRSLEKLYPDARMYDGNFGPGMQEVYTIDSDIEKYFTSSDSWFKYYVVDPEVDLKQNTYRDMFYVVSFKDGDVWANIISYADCWNWTEGKSCRNDGFVSDWDQRNIIYTLVDAEKKTPKIEMTPEEVSSTDDEPGLTDVELNPTDSGEGGNMTELDNEVGQIDNIVIATQDPMETNSDENLPLITEVASTVKYLTDSTSEAVEKVNVSNESSDSNISDDEESEEVDFDDESEGVNEGFGDTTLEVPALGANVKESDNINFWPYILMGFAVGMFSSWFLLLVILKKKIQER